MFKSKVLLITGGTGSFGNAVLKRFLESNIMEIRIFSRDEKKQDDMRVLLVTQYFFPENFKSNDIAFELSKRGYKVTVLTGIPNYPSGKFFKGYGQL